MKEISIIVCSQKGKIDHGFYENIDKTIGAEYDLILINNSENQFSVFEAYNLGLKRTQTPFAVFIHEDILFHTNNWGEVLLKLFNDQPEYGLIGVAGANIKTKFASGWWDCPNENKFLHLIQHFPNGKVKKESIGFKSPGIKDAVALDGVFLALRKDLALSFDEGFSGFHGYDLNIGFEVLRKNFKIGITNLILIEHFSYGTQSAAWLESVIQVHRKYKDLLPLFLVKKEVEAQEIINCQRLVEKSLKFEKNKLFCFYWFKLFLLDPWSTRHLLLLKRLNFLR